MKNWKKIEKAIQTFQGDLGIIGKKNRFAYFPEKCLAMAFKRFCAKEGIDTNPVILPPTPEFKSYKVRVYNA